MKLRFAMTSAIGVAVLSQFTAPASAATLINNETFGSGLADSFNISVGSPVGTLGAFTVTAGNVDLIGNGGSNNFYSGNGNYIDLNGNTAGTITSTGSFTFTNGGNLSFSYGANGAGRTATVSIGGTTLLPTLTASQSGAFSTLNYTIASGVAGALSFTSTSAGSGGIVLDNILLTSIDPASSTAVPEPFTVIGTLIGGSAALRLKKKLKADSNV